MRKIVCLIVLSCVAVNFANATIRMNPEDSPLEQASARLRELNLSSLHSSLNETKNTTTLLNIFRNNGDKISHSAVLQIEAIAKIRHLFPTMANAHKKQIRGFMLTSVPFDLSESASFPKKRMKFESISDDITASDIEDMLASDSNIFADKNSVIIIKSTLQQMIEDTEIQSMKNKLGTLMCRVILRWLRCQNMPFENKFTFAEKKITALIKDATVYDEYFLMLNDLLHQSGDTELISKIQKVAQCAYEQMPIPAYKICFPLLFPANRFHLFLYGW